VLTGLKLELIKLYRSRVTYLGFAAILLLALPVALEARYHGVGREISRQVGRDAVIGGRILTAQVCAARIMTPAFYVFVPMLVAVVAGGLVAGEAASGTLRTILVRPVRRWALLASKFLAGVFHATLLCYSLAAVCLILGGLLLGFGDLWWADGGIVVHPSGQALARLALAYGLASFSMWTMVAISLLFSVLFRSPAAAAGAAVALLILCGIMTGLESFHSVRPYLFTTHMNLHMLVFRSKIPWADVLAHAKVLAAYTAGGFLLSGLIFSRKDILC